MEITARKATVADYPAVLALDPDHRIYSGNDYMPSQYHAFIRDPNKTITVGLLDNKIVVLAMANFVDNGETVVGMAARNHPDVRGHGVWRALRNAPAARMPNDPMLTVKHFAGVTDLTQWHNLKLQNDNLWGTPCITMRQDFRIYEFDATLIERQDKRVGSDGLVTRIFTADESLNSLRSPDIQFKLFPNKRIVCNIGLVVYKLCDSNFRRIITNSDGITATVDCNGTCKSMAFGSGLEVHNGYQYSLHYFGINHCDVTDIIQHVLTQLPLAANNQSKQPLQVRLFFPPEMCEKKLTTACKAIPGFVRVASDVISLVAFERNKRDLTAAKL